MGPPASDSTRVWERPGIKDVECQHQLIGKPIKAPSRQLPLPARPRQCRFGSR